MRFPAVINCNSIRQSSSLFFFFKETATTEIYTLSLHDALPIYHLNDRRHCRRKHSAGYCSRRCLPKSLKDLGRRSEEHTSELQSRQYLVCRLLLEKKKFIRDMTLPTCNS